MRGLLALVVSVLVSASVLAVPASVAATSTPGIAYVLGGPRSEPTVWIADGTGGNGRKLGQGDGPALSPDGQTVALSDLGSTGPAISLYPASGGPPTWYFSVAH